MPVKTRFLLPVVLSVLLLGAGCGDDDNPGGPGAGASKPTAVPTTGSDGKAPFALLEGEPCDSEVRLTGAVKATWSGEGVVDRPETGPVAVYQSVEGTTVLTVYAPGNGFDANVVVSDGTDSYGTSFDAPGLDVAADGSGATIDAEAIVPDGDASVRVVATFSC